MNKPFDAELFQHFPSDTLKAMRDAEWDPKGRTIYDNRHICCPLGFCALHADVLPPNLYNVTAPGIVLPQNCLEIWEHNHWPLPDDKYPSDPFADFMHSWDLHPDPARLRRIVQSLLIERNPS